MQIPFFQIDAFTGAVFAGNPAGVCPLPRWLPRKTLQAIAAENNLSETAFFVDRGSYYDLRWFAPVAEVNLCGHATLASAFVLFHELGVTSNELVFQTRSGELRVRRDDPRLVLDFPTRQPQAVEPPDGLFAALGNAPAELWLNDYYLAIYDTADQVARLRPDMARLARLRHGVIVSAPGTDCDFVSRFFAPAIGVPEDPVTGSAHCLLTPYWSRRLDKPDLHARQISARGGELYCRDCGARTLIAGQAVKYLEGTLNVRALAQPNPLGKNNLSKSSKLLKRYNLYSLIRAGKIGFVRKP